ncbi:MAG: hypothetical protein ACTSRI_20655 [Promethearchaeota archaeon]
MSFDDIMQYDKKLEKVNGIMQKIAQDNEYITPIVPSDYGLFEAFFDKEERHTYGNSWLYVTQGAYGIGPEKLGYKYYDGKNLCTLALYPKIEQPNTIMLYWIRPLGETMLSVIVDLAEKIKQKYGVCSYVKKLFPDQYEFLLKNGFKSAFEFPWHSTAPLEDDTYPELIYDRIGTLDALSNPTNRTQLGRTLKEIRKFKCDNKVEITSNDFETRAWNVANTYFTTHNSISNKPNLSSSFDYYNMIHVDHSCHPDIEKKILLVNEKPVGFYIMMRNAKFNVTSIYSYITLRQHYKYLTDLLKLFVLETENTKYINSGGSEDIGIYAFKQKYLPVRENIMCWTTNYSDGL